MIKHYNYKTKTDRIYFSLSDSAPQIEGGELNSLKSKKEEAETKELPVEVMVAKTNQTLEANNDRMTMLPSNLKDALRNNIVQYFLTSADRYDKDREKGLDQIEFGEYQAGMDAKLGEIIDKYAPTEEMIEERRRQAEDVRKSSEKAEGEAEKGIEDIAFDPAKLDTPEGVHGELQKLVAQTAKLQQSGAALSLEIGGFKKAFARFEEGKKEWSVFLRGSPLVDDDETEQLESAKARLQMSAVTKMHELEVKVVEIRNTGKIINEAPEKIKQEQLIKREENRQRIEQARAEEERLGRGEVKNGEERTRLEANRHEITQKRVELMRYKASLLGQIAETESKEGGATKSRELKGEQLTGFNDHLDGAIKQIDGALESPNLTEWQRQNLEAKREELLAHKQTAETGLASLKEVESDQRGMFEKAKDDLFRATTGAATQELNIDDHINKTLSPAIDSLESAMKTIEIAKLQSGTKLEQLEAEQMILDSNIEMVDKMDQNAADTVLDINLGNVQFLNGLQSQIEEVDKIEIDRPGVWDASGGLFFGKVGEGLSLISDEVLDPIGDWAIRRTKDIPFVGTTVEIATNIVIGIPSGVIDGAGELVSGINTMISHPIQTIKGLGALVGPNAGEAWKEMGKALIAWDEFEKGKAGKGIGKIALNVLLTATGAGAAVKGGQALALTFKAARAAGAGVAKAAAKAAWMGAKVATVEAGSTLKAAPKGIATSAKTILGTPKRLGQFLIEKGKELMGKGEGKLVKLEQAAAKTGNELATASSKLDEVTIGGQKVSEIKGLAGKSCKEVQAMTGAELAGLGLKDAKSVREFMKYKQALKEAESLKLAADTAKTAKIGHQLEMASLELKSATIGGKKVSKLKELKGKSLQEVEKLSDAELAALGINDVKSMDEFLKYKESLRAVEELQIARAKDIVARIRAGTLKGFENYEGIRDIAKQAGLSMEEQLQLTKQFLENSGKKIEDMIKLEDTIGPMKPVEVTGTVDDIVRGTEGVEKVISKLDEAKSLSQMNEVITGIANPVERQLLSRLLDDLSGMKITALDEAEKVTILKESLRYLRDYKAALREGGMGSVKSSQDVFDLIRGNQRKLAHQTVVDRRYFTGSDHGVTHILDANMAMADKIFADMGGKVSARDRVLVRQAILDHDMGYTINTLEDAKGGKYFGMTKDHPLYSTVWVESNKAEYVKYFGEEGYTTIRNAILDHSNAKKFDLTATGGKLVENVVAGVDCLGTTADIKMMKLFRDPEIMAELMQLQELAEELKTATTPARKAKIIKEMNEVKRVMETFVKKSKKFDKQLKESYLKALRQNFDPTNPEFAFKRDFGSHSAGFEGIKVADDGSVTVNMSVNENFRLVREMFGQGDEISTNALAKAMDDYGLKIGEGKAPRVTVTRDGVETTLEYSQEQFAADLAKVERGEMVSLTVKTPRATFNFIKNAEKGKELSSVLRRERAFKEVMRKLESPDTSLVDACDTLESFAGQYRWDGYVLGSKPARKVIREIQDLIGSGKKEKAVQLLRDLRFKGTKLLT